jgi:hypothetical protein
VQNFEAISAQNTGQCLKFIDIVLTKNSKVWLSWKRMYSIKCFFIFLQILSNVKKIKILTFARMNTFMGVKKLKNKFPHFFFIYCSEKMYQAARLMEPPQGVLCFLEIIVLEFGRD